MFEKLENRQLFAITTSLVDGTLTIVGDKSNDTVLFDKSGNADSPNVRAQLDGRFEEWAADAVKKIVINTNGGNDKVVVGNLQIPCEIHGGSGNDTLSGGDNNDTITGGAGNDYLFGRAGDDVLDGGDGSDTVLGQTGDDTILISAKPGRHDFFSGGDGNDLLDGRGSAIGLALQIGRVKPKGFATAVITDDFEVIHGSKYADVMRDFGTHSIAMYGNGGVDILIGGTDHADTLDGGTGVDTIVSNNIKSWIFSSDNAKDLISGQVVSSHIKGDKLDLLNLKLKV